MIIEEIDGIPVDNDHAYWAKRQIDEYFDLDPMCIDIKKWIYFELSEDEYKEIIDYMDERIRMTQIYGLECKKLLRRCVGGKIDGRI